MAVAGWYNDEIDPTLARWYDGAGWTDHVVDKAAWEAYGQPPPPPDELDPPNGAGRLRPLIGSAVVVALLAVAGVALANDGDGGSPERSPTARTSRSTDRSNGGTTADPDALTVDPLLDATSDADGQPVSGDGPSGTGGRSSSATASTKSNSTATSTASGGVRRTETSTRTQSNPGPITAAPPGDETSVGNNSDRDIRNTYTPPPETTTTSAPAGDPPAQEPPPTEPPAEPA